MSDLIRSVSFSPAWDKRNPEPGKNYGIHCAEIRFAVKGDRGAVSFLVFTGWHLPHVQEQFRGDRDSYITRPRGASIDYHSFAPLYEGQNAMTESCAMLDGKPCYCDGSCCAADDLFLVLIRDGEAAMWAELESWYAEKLGKLEPIAEAI
jgi:hypothetical protein